MSEYTRWQQLNEHLGFPLGVKSAASLGLAGGLNAFEEGKKKKKMSAGDEISLGPDMDDEIGDDGDDGVDAPEKGPSPSHDCKCGEPAAKPDNPLMCKKCGKGMKKGMKKNMKHMKEDIFASYESGIKVEAPEVGTEEYRQAFFRSLDGHNVDPNRRFDSGVNLGEEVIFRPEEEITSVPQPGQPGFAPQSRVGNMTSGQAVGQSEWERDWTRVAEEFLEFCRHKR